MLLDFTFENVRSFKNKATFSMDVGDRISRLQRKNTHRQKDTHILKSAYILGGNAAGKSNLLYALVMLREVVLLGTASDLTPLFTDTYASNKENTKFCIRFYKNNKLFKYSIVYNAEFISEESLYVNEHIVFNREKLEFTVPPTLEMLKNSVRNNQPLLYFAQNNNVLEAKEAYEWFSQDLVAPRLLGNSILDQQIFKPLLSNSELKENTLFFLKAADFNITDINVSEIIYDENTEFKRKQLQVDFVHLGEDGNKFILNWSAESTGTKIFIMLAMYILQYNYKNTVFIIDEFDRSLHPKLVEVLIRLFNEWNTKNQFILTTHNNEIINNSLRSDQIWFVDKNYQGVSDLYSAFDFDSIPTMNQLKKNYQNGLYGGNQIINEDMLLDILRNRHE